MLRSPRLSQIVPRSLPWLLLLGLAGCATSPAPVAPVTPVAPAPPMGPTYSPPAHAPVAPSVVSPPAVPLPDVPAKPATVVGSEESSTLLDNFTAYVAAVDGHTMTAGRAGWNVPLTLPAGPHRLKVAFNRGVFAAEAELPLTARPARAYEVKFSSDAEFFGRNSYCEFWLVDTATGEPVTNRVRAVLARRETSTAK